MRLLLLAPPGAGKGTQGERLAAWSSVRHIAAGDLLRTEARAGDRLGREIAAYQARGDLVPDQIVLDVLTPVVVEAAAEGGYILDGFPRTLPQAIAAADLAARLGVKRPTVSLVANALQRAGFIRYHRGVVRIVDRPGLERSACDCFKIIKAVYGRIMER